VAKFSKFENLPVAHHIPHALRVSFLPNFLNLRENFQTFLNRWQNFQNLKITRSAPHTPCATGNFPKKIHPPPPPLWTAFSEFQKIKENDKRFEKNSKNEI
jgi:hypothetical protein